MTAPDRDRSHYRRPRSLAEGVARFVLLPALVCGAYLWHTAREMSPRTHEHHVVPHAPSRSHHVVVRAAPVATPAPSVHYERVVPGERVIRSGRVVPRQRVIHSERVVPSGKATIWRESKTRTSEPLYVMLPNASGPATTVYKFRDSKGGLYRPSESAKTVSVSPTTVRTSTAVLAGVAAQP